MGSTTVPSDYAFAVSEVFVLLFVTLGPPLKVPALFLATTRHLDEGVAKGLASKAFVRGGRRFDRRLHRRFADAEMACVRRGIAACRWHRVLPGVAARRRGRVRQGGSGTPPQGANARTPTAFEIAVPMLVTPYGLAAIILLIARSQDTTRLVSIAALVLVVMFLNLLAMRYARPVMDTIGPIPLQLFGTIVAC